VALLVLGGGGAVAYVYGGAPKKKGVNRDPKKLLPPFARKLNILFNAMRARGFQPMLWEGRRSGQRAAELSTRGTGILLSMHTLGAAVDIVDGSSANPWKAKPGFWKALGEEAAKLGLTWGGDWQKRDFPHVQALAVRDQPAFRRMTPADRVSFVA
jgi:peptidoglycan L-alanyl-D-glutamate endopeptidase CwlK